MNIIIFHKITNWLSNYDLLIKIISCKESFEIVWLDRNIMAYSKFSRETY